MNTVLSEYINKIHDRPMNVVWNSCFHKAIRIFKRAKELGLQAELIIGIGISPPILLWRFRYLSPHAYVITEGEKVDVALSPKQERRYWKNGKGTLL